VRDAPESRSGLIGSPEKVQSNIRACATPVQGFRPNVTIRRRGRDRT
jgi:hypothetical protein